MPVLRALINGNWVDISYPLGTNLAMPVTILSKTSAGESNLTLGPATGQTSPEGGQIDILGGQGYSPWKIDTYQARLRLLTPNGNTFSFDDTNGNGALVFGTHPIHNGRSIWPNNDETGSGYILLRIGANQYFNAPSGGSIFLRVNNADITTFASNQVTVTGYLSVSQNVNCSGVLYFPGGGSGWYMADSTWVRTYQEKGVWAGGGALGSDGGCVIARSGNTANLGTYKLDVASHVNVDLTCHANQHQGRHGQATGWNQSHILAYNGVGEYAQMAFYNAAGGFSPQERTHSTEGWCITAVNGDQSGFSDYKGWSFRTASSATLKEHIRSVSPDMEPRPAEVPWDSDVIDQADVMSLRPVIYRRKGFAQQIVPAEGWDEVDPMYDDSFEIVEHENPLVRMEHNRERLGLVAEEVATVLPSAVQFDNNTGDAASLDYNQIVVALLDHVQRLTRTVETLQYRIAELEGNAA